MSRAPRAALAALLLLIGAALAAAQTLAADRQVLAPGTWRARTGQATVIADEVRMTTGASLQAWADDQAGTVSKPFQITATTPRLNTYIKPGVYAGDFSLAADKPPSASADTLFVSADHALWYRSQALIGRGWGTVWTRRTSPACPDPCASPTWTAWVTHDLSTTGLTADQVEAAIAAQEGQQSSDVLDAILGLLLRRTGDSESFTFSGTLGPAVTAENFGSRLDADDDVVARIDVQKLHAISGAVLATYDPILVVRATISGLTDAGSSELLDASTKYLQYPLREAGVPAASGQAVRVGRNGTGLLVGFGAAESAVAYRVTASGLDETVDAQGVASALQSLPTASVDGHALRDVPVSYGATLPAAATSTPGALYVQETAGVGSLRWLRPAGAVPTPSRNRVQIVAQASDGLAYRGWEDHPYDPAKAPDNYNRLVGALERIHIGGTNDYVYSIYLRDSMLADMGITTEVTSTPAVQIGLFGEMRPFRRWAASDPRLGETVEVSSDGITYVQYRTAPITGQTSAPNFVSGTTYDILFWAASNNSAINFKPATTRSPAAWEPPVPAPVEVITTALPSITGYRIGDQILLRGGTVGARTWTLYILASNEDGDPGAWVRPS